MIAIGEHRPTPPRDPVHRPRESGADCLHTAPERVAIARLDDQVRVVPLQRVVHEPKSLAITPDGEGPFDLVNDSDSTQRRNVGAHAQRDVRGQWRTEVLTPCVLDGTLGLSTGALTSTNDRRAILTRRSPGTCTMRTQVAAAFGPWHEQRWHDTKQRQLRPPRRPGEWRADLDPAKFISVRRGRGRAGAPPPLVRRRIRACADFPRRC